MSYRIEDFQNDPNWQPSVGEKLDMIHFRNGHWHAEIDPKTGFGDIHYDKYDPNESFSSLVDHVWESNTGKALMITGAVAILDHVFNDGNLRKSVQGFLSE